MKTHYPWKVTAGPPHLDILDADDHCPDCGHPWCPDCGGHTGHDATVPAFFSCEACGWKGIPIGWLLHRA